MAGPDEAELPGISLEEIDLCAPELYVNGYPHAVWDLLREKAPVWRQQAPSGQEFWSFTRYDDVVAVLKNARGFSSEYGTVLAVVDGDIGSGKTINLMDPPQHTAVRSPCFQLMSTNAMAAYEAGIRRTTRRMIEEFVEAGGGDFADLVSVFPMVIAGPILGLPEEHWRDAVRWTAAGVAPDDPEYSMGTVEETLREAHFGLLEVFDSVQQEPGGHDLVTALTGVRLDGHPLTPQEIQLNCYTFTMGANITTGHVLSHLVLRLLDQPELWQRMRRDPCCLEPVMDEAIRWSTPTNHLLRRAEADIAVNGVVVPEGTLVCTWVASANRDASVFTDPYRFDVDRTPNRHIGFGSGPHFCIGSPAARVGLLIFLQELADLVEEFAPAGPVRHLRSNFINGLTRLPVAVRRSAGRMGASA